MDFLGDHAYPFFVLFHAPLARTLERVLSLNMSGVIAGNRESPRLEHDYQSETSCSCPKPRNSSDHLIVRGGAPVASGSLPKHHSRPSRLCACKRRVRAKDWASNQVELLQCGADRD